MWKPVYHPGPWKAFLDRKDNKGLPLMEVRKKYLKEQLDYETLHPPTVNFNSPKGLSPEEFEEYLKNKFPNRGFSCNPTGPTLLSYQSDFSTLDGWVAPSSTPTPNQTIGGLSPVIRLDGGFREIQDFYIDRTLPESPSTLYDGAQFDLSFKVLMGSGTFPLNPEDLTIYPGLSSGVRGGTPIDLTSQLVGAQLGEWRTITYSGTWGSHTSALRISLYGDGTTGWVAYTDICLNIYSSNFVCEVAETFIRDQGAGSFGDPVIDKVNVGEGTVLSVTPANFLVGTNSYSVDIVAPSGYSNAGAIITCVVDDVTVGSGPIKGG